MKVGSAVASASMVLCLTIALCARAAPNNPPTSWPSSGVHVGEAPPPLSAMRVAGEDDVSLTGLAGRVVVLDFWATWCRPCRAIMPALDAMYRQHHAAGLSVVGVSPEPTFRIREHLSTNPVHYTIAHDLGGTMRAYGVRGIPMLVVLDRRGQVRDTLMGVDGASMRRLSALVTQLLAEPVP